MCSGSEAGSYVTLVSLSLWLKELLGPLTRVKKRSMDRTTLQLPHGGVVGEQVGHSEGAGRTQVAR